MKNMLKITRKVSLKNPYLIAAWPGMGNVAFKTASYLIETLHAQEFAILQTADLFYPEQAQVNDGILDMPHFPKDKFFYWKQPVIKTHNKQTNNDLIIFLSEAQPSPDKGYLYAHKILEIAESLKVKRVFTFAAMPTPIEHTHVSSVWVSTTDRSLLLDMKHLNLKTMEAGPISGLNGLLLSVAKERGLEGICLLGEIPLYTIQIDNPKANFAILDILARVIGLNLDLGELRLQIQLQEEEINKLIEYFRGGPEHKEAISEDEIDRIKKSLQAFTKLPNSVRETIEKLFESAKKDIAKAQDLKKELDKWSIYKDYEDRFLDLFKKEGQNTDNQ
jgi:proteasome assembly chaperone (PAC2) family protein